MQFVDSEFMSGNVETLRVALNIRENALLPLGHWRVRLSEVGTADAKFTHGSTLRHVVIMSLTSSLGIMALFTVDLIDMVFVSMLGQDALAAAAGYAAILLFFTNSINMGLSIAAGVLVSKAIGAGDHEQAREYATSVAIFAVITGLLIPSLVLPNAHFLLAQLGATGEVADKAVSYLWILMPTMGVLGVAMTGSAVLYSNGDARRAMYVTLSGGAVNFMLDPILIFGLGMDLQGAALASAIARFVTLFFALRPAIKMYNGFSRPSFSLLVRDFAPASALVAPAVLTNLATPVGSAIVTREMAKYGTDAVAGMAIVGRLVPVAFSVVFALSGAIGPIVGQNFGAGLLPRVKEAFWDGIKFTLLYVLGVALLLFLLREPIANLFGATGIARELIYLFCGPLALVYIFSGSIYISNATFNNLGHPVYSTWLNWGVHTAGTLPFVILGGMYFGAPGVLMGQALGQMLFSILAVVFARHVIANPAEKLHLEPFHLHRRNHQIYCRGNR